jgi:hypothetical protein
MEMKALIGKFASERFFLICQKKGAGKNLIGPFF